MKSDCTQTENLFQKIGLKISDEKIQKLFYHVMLEKPEKSDVVVWLQGDRYDRGNKVLELFKKGFASKILISGNNVRVGKPNEIDAFHDTNLDEMENFLMENGVNQKDILIDGSSLTTAEHPKNVLAFAKNNNWEKIILVSSPYHQLRVFLSFVKYFNDNNIDVRIINQPAMNLLWGDMAGGKTKTREELFTGELIKIEQYKNDVATYEQGLKYITRQDIITLRPVSIIDANKLFEWRNDPIVRNNSFNEELIDLEQHLLWFKKILNDTNRHSFIILNENNEEIGQVRFDVNDCEAEISITLDKNFRSRGYGTKSIKHSSKKFLKEHKQLKRIIARVKTENKLSSDAFKKAGFLEMNRNNLTVHMKFEL